MRMSSFGCVVLVAMLVCHQMSCIHESYMGYLDRYDVKPLEKTFNVTDGGIFSDCLYPSDCKAIQDCDKAKSGVYRVFPFGVGNGFLVYCDMTTDGGGWLVFQRRQDGTVDFYRNWQSYKNGFGNLYGEFWLGLEKMHLLTSQRHYKLLINLEAFKGESGKAAYSRFRISGEKDKFRLMVGAYSGTAGDAMTYHDGYQFSTPDSDNDGNVGVICTARDHGAWWYDDCQNSNLNGEYVHAGGMPRSAYSGIAGYTWLMVYGNVQFTEMKIRPVGSA
ncbi:fibrinogen C domain-containing protein 1-like [Liolophura sinensis]|uniref:fibrinogen C domain-containing protein 1-like n=1 Tax=Liolophura sinensis TaxID=3198878 RepID=UPI00315914BC